MNKKILQATQDKCSPLKGLFYGLLSCGFEGAPADTTWLVPADLLFPASGMKAKEDSQFWGLKNPIYML